MMKAIGLRIVRKLGNSVRRLYWISVYDDYRRRYEISPTFRFNGFNVLLFGTGAIALGQNSYIGEGSSVQAFTDCKVVIGRGCQISHNVRFYTHSAVADSDFSQAKIPHKAADIHVGDYCWIGANAFIGPGVTIGRNAVVGANSVVTQNIPENEIWGGVPARHIRKKRLLT